ncbi:MAG: ankyrin repeat domain-containing protein [Phycisphaerae bacterium]
MSEDELYKKMMFGSFKDLNELLASDPSLVRKTHRFGMTPLHWVVTEDRPDVIQLLLKSGANPNAADDRGMTPMHLAQGTRNIAVLLENGGNPNAQSKDGSTPLHVWAAEGEDTGSLENMAALLAAGADPNIKDNDEKTPLDYAIQREEEEKVQLLNSHHAAPRKKATPSFTRVIEPLVIMLVGKSYDELLEIVDKSRMTAADIAKCIRSYGRTLKLPPADAYDFIDAVAIDASATPQWSVRVNLWTVEEGKSDLTLELTVTERSPRYAVEIDDLHVL